MFEFLMHEANQILNRGCWISKLISLHFIIINGLILLNTGADIITRYAD